MQETARFGSGHAEVFFEPENSEVFSFDAELKKVIPLGRLQLEAESNEAAQDEVQKLLKRSLNRAHVDQLPVGLLKFLVPGLPFGLF